MRFLIGQACQITNLCGYMAKFYIQEGQTPVPSELDKIDMHFVCFVHHEGTLYQLDGRKDAPVAHGSTKPESLLADAADVIRSTFMAADTSEHRFTVVALTAAPL